MVRGARPSGLRVVGWVVIALAFAGCSLLGKNALDEKPLESELTGGGGTGGSEPTGGGGGGGLPGCQSHTECPGADTTCRFRVCEAGECGFDNAEALTSCTEDEGKVCDGNGGCVGCLDGAQCTGNEACVDNKCVPPHCTDNTKNEDETDIDCGGDACGPCDNTLMCLVPTDCKSKFCNGGTCEACDDSSECSGVPETYCAAGVCVPQKTLNDVCTGADECLSGSCADGVCCDAACDAPCETCTGGSGMCSAVPAGNDYHNDCSAQGASTCGTTGNCNGNAMNPGCLLHPSGTVCAGSTCSMGEESLESTCDGMGSCVAGGTMPCGAYACDNDSCHTSCSGVGDCASSAYCKGTSCQACSYEAPMGGNTISCTSNGQCQGDMLNCPPGAPCTVNCTGKSSCNLATINCPPDHPCLVVCGDNNACDTATINCGDASCGMTCNGTSNVCSSAQLMCGDAPCQATCTGSSQPNVTCPSSNHCNCTGC